MTELHGYYIEDLSPGMSAVFSKTVTDADIVLFGGVSGDSNPLHYNEDFATESVFGGRVAHGMLVASFVSAVFGTKLPGPGCIYMSQQLKFHAPVRAGDTVIARVTVKDVVQDKKRVTFFTVCTVGDTVVLDGEATIMVPSRAAQQPATTKLAEVSAAT
jgi:3-hydroxybutyryl-CoA dehydratase